MNVIYSVYNFIWFKFEVLILLTDLLLYAKLICKRFASNSLFNKNVLFDMFGLNVYYCVMQRSL